MYKQRQLIAGSKKEQEENSFLQKTKKFVKTYVGEIVASVFATGAFGFFVLKNDWISNLFLPKTEGQHNDTKLPNQIKDVIDKQLDSFLDNLPKEHGQTIWLSDTDKVRIKRILQRVFDGEKNDPAGEFLRLLREPGVLRKDEVAIRTITLRIDQNKLVESELKAFLGSMERLNVLKE